MQLHVSFYVCLPCHFFSVQDADYPTDEIDVFIFAEAHDRISRVVGMQAIRLIFLDVQFIVDHECADVSRFQIAGVEYSARD